MKDASDTTIFRPEIEGRNKRKNKGTKKLVHGFQKLQKKQLQRKMSKNGKRNICSNNDYEYRFPISHIYNVEETSNKWKDKMKFDMQKADIICFQISKRTIDQHGKRQPILCTNSFQPSQLKTIQDPKAFR